MKGARSGSGPCEAISLQGARAAHGDTVKAQLMATVPALHRGAGMARANTVDTLKRIQIGAVLGWGVVLAATGCSPVGDASGPNWFVVPDRFTDGLPDASVGSGGSGLSEEYLLPPVIGAGNGGTGGSGGSAGGSAGSPNGGTGGSTLGDAGTEPPDGGAPPPMGIGDPWYFDAPEELAAFQVIDTGITSTRVWRAGQAGGDAGVDAGQTDVDSGHIELTAPFTTTNQAVQFFITLPNFTDFTGRVLKVRVKRAPGIGQGGVQPFVQSTEGWTWVSGTWNPLSALTELTDVTLDFDLATDPQQVKRFGIQLHSGTQPGNIETVQIAIDDVRIE